MNLNRTGFSVGIAALLILILPLTGINCKLVENPPGVAAVQNVSLKIISDSTGTRSAAIVSWSASSDENTSDFSGYRLVTYQLDDNNNVNSVFNKVNLSKTAHIYTIDSIGTGVKYQTFIFSILSDGSKSDSVGSIVYAGVFYRSDGIIDQYQPGDQSYILSGYGWDEPTGVGYNLSYIFENTAYIDMNLRSNSSGILIFASPATFSPGTRTTLFSLVGTGQAAFDQTDLDEPTAYTVDVDSNNVYLLKLQEGNYVKVWVRAIRYIAGAIPPYYNVIFDYKVQPIAGLRAL